MLIDHTIHLPFSSPPFHEQRRKRRQDTYTTNFTRTSGKLTLSTMNIIEGESTSDIGKTQQMLQLIHTGSTGCLSSRNKWFNTLHNYTGRWLLYPVNSGKTSNKFTNRKDNIHTVA